MVSTTRAVTEAKKKEQKLEIIRDLEQMRKDSPNAGYDYIITKIAQSKHVKPSMVKDIDQKQKAADFEIDILKFMKKFGKQNVSDKLLHFEDVRGTVKKKSDIITLKFKDKRGGEFQVDAVGRIGNTIFVVECKRTDDEGGTYSGLESEIHKHERRVDQFIDALNDRNPPAHNKEIFATTELQGFNHDGSTRTRNVVGVFALENVIIPGLNDPNETSVLKRALKKRNCEVWDDNFRTYYDQLHNLIGEYAIYSMLGEMHIKNDEKYATSTWALRTEIQSPNKDPTVIYQFLLDPRRLLKISTVARRNRPGQEYYQRSLIGKKLTQIRKYFEGGKLAPNNIIIGLEPDEWEQTSSGSGFSPINIKKCAPGAAKRLLAEEKKQREKNSNIMKVEYGTLTFPRAYSSCWVIDGQHRLYGAAKVSTKSKKSKKGTQRALALGELKLPIIAFANLSPTKMAEMFLDINTNQKPIAANLKYDLFGDYNPTSKKGVVSQIAKALNEKSGGGLQDKIYWPQQGLGKEDKNKRIGIAAFCEGILDSNLIRHNLKRGVKNPCATREERAVYTPTATDDAYEKRWLKDVKTNVVKQIDEFYKEYARYYPDEASLGDKGFLFNRQTSKVLLPLLAEILAHAKTKANANKLKPYLKGLAKFQQDNDTGSRKTRVDSASRRSLAGGVIKEMCLSIRESKRSRFGKFAQNRLIAVKSDWSNLFEYFGLYVDKHMKTWEDYLTPTLKSDLQVRKGNDGSIEDGEEYKLVEMQDIAKVFDKNTNDGKNLDLLVSHFKQRLAFRGMSSSEIKEGLKEDLTDLENEWNADRHVKSYPTMKAEKNKGKRKALLQALKQLDLESDDDAN